MNHPRPIARSAHARSRSLLFAAAGLALILPATTARASEPMELGHMDERDILYCPPNGDSTLTGTFSMFGTVEVPGGTLTLTNSGATESRWAGTTNLSAGAAVLLSPAGSAGKLNLSGATFAGDGTVTFDTYSGPTSGGITVDAGRAATFATAVNFNNGAYLTGAATGDYVFLGDTTVVAGGSVALSGATARFAGNTDITGTLGVINSGVVENTGTLTLSGGIRDYATEPTGAFVNRAGGRLALTATGGAAPSFTLGAFTHEAGASFVSNGANSYVRAGLTQRGSVTIESGTFTAVHAGTQDGVWAGTTTVAADAKLLLWNHSTAGKLDLSDAFFTGAGTVKIECGLAHGTTVAATRTAVFDVAVELGDSALSGAEGGVYSFQGGTTVDTGKVVRVYGATVRTAGATTVRGMLGSMAGGVIENTGTLALTGGTLGEEVIRADAGLIINRENGVIELRTDSAAAKIIGRFNNDSGATLRNAVGDNAVTGAIRQDGLVLVHAGTALTVDHAGLSDSHWGGVTTVEAGATLTLRNAASSVWNGTGHDTSGALDLAGAVFDGAGRVRLLSTQYGYGNRGVTLAPGGTATFNTGVDLAGATLVGDATGAYVFHGDTDLRAGGRADFYGAHFRFAGATAIGGGLSLMSDATLENAGTLTLSGTMSGSGTLDNFKTLAVTGGGVYGATLVNHSGATVSLDATSGAVTLRDVAFINEDGATLVHVGGDNHIAGAITQRGAVEVRAGTLAVASAAPFGGPALVAASSPAVPASGVWAGSTTVAPGAALSLGAQSRVPMALADAAFAIDGTVELAHATGSVAHLSGAGTLVVGATDLPVFPDRGPLLRAAVTAEGPPETPPEITWEHFVSEVTLGADNTGFTGTVAVTGGKLTLGHDAALGAGALTVADGVLATAGALTLANGVTVAGAGVEIATDGGDLTLAGVLAGDGTIRKTGENRLVLTNAANTYSGTVVISAGVLRLGALGALGGGAYRFDGGVLDIDGHTLNAGTLAGTGRIETGAGGVITVDQSTATEFSGVISGAGGLELRGPGTLTLSGENRHSGALAVSGSGTLVATHAALGLGGVTLGERGTLAIVGTGDDGRVTGAISGAGGTLALTGAGVTHLDGRVTLPGGAIRVDDGRTLDIGANNTLTVGTLAVGPGGRLTGSGAVFGTIAITGGVHAPGNSPGLVTVADYALTGATLQIEIAGAGAVAGTDFDRVAYTNSATITGGSTLEVTGFGGYTPANGQTVRFLSGPIPVTGRFAHLTGGAFGVVAYDDAGATVTVYDRLAAVSGLADARTAPFLRALSAAAPTPGDALARPVVDRLVAGDLADAARQVANASPLSLAALTAMPVSVSARSVDFLRSRENTDRAAPAAGAVRWSAYAAGNSTVTQAKDDADAPVFDHTVSGGKVGLDYGATQVVGLVAGYDIGKATPLHGGGKADMNRASVMAYCTQTFATTGFAQIGAGVGTSSFETRRGSAFGTVTGDTDGTDVGVAAVVGCRSALGGSFDIVPYAGLAYTRASVDGFTESGGPLALRVGDYRQDSLRAKLGGDFGWKVAKRVRLGLDVAIERELMDAEVDIPASFASGAGDFITAAPATPETILSVGPNLSYGLTDRTSVSVGYKYESGPDAGTAHRFDAAFTARF